MQAELKELFIDKEPTRQEVFDFVVSKLVQQGQPSIDENSDSACVYRGKNNLKCAAGWLLPDEMYVSHIEGSSVYCDTFQKLFKKTEVYWFKKSSKYYRLIDNLQDAHDGSGRALFVDVFLVRAKKVAGMHRLKMKERAFYERQNHTDSNG